MPQPGKLHRGDVVLVPVPFSDLTGRKVNSLLRADKLATLSAGIISRRLGRLGPATQARTQPALRRAVGLA